MINGIPTYISLFSSAGVGCYGFLEENYECIATNEIIERRMDIQKINKKCKLPTGYITGDIKEVTTKNLIYDEINKWEEQGNDRVDVVIATPPCQGMSVANHKKTDKDIDRNSLILESINLVNDIKPRFFLFENVRAFWNTGAYNNDGELVSIGDMIMDELSEDYVIHKEIVNFKNYGSNSSRTRTLVIGVSKELSEEVSPIELFPDYQPEKSWFDVSGDMKSLDWGEYDKDDFYHSFRTYPERMRKWIQDLEQGQSAFENEEDVKKPHRIIDGELVVNKAKNGDKYKRQVYNEVAPCIHTRNDQLASQNTVHPIDDRVFSIRELMRMMTIPDTFKWSESSLDELNSLSFEDKQKVSKRTEMNIRQSIGEAVPTSIFRQIAKKIKKILSSPRLSIKEIKKIIEENNLYDVQKLLRYVEESKAKYSISTLSRIVEYANSSRISNSAYYTNKYIIQEIYKNLPEFNKDEVLIIEPSVGAGNFLPFIFKKYEAVKKVRLKVIDIDENAINLLKCLYTEDVVPQNFEIEYIHADYLYFEHEKADLIIGNPPFTKINGDYRKALVDESVNKDLTNLSGFFLEKAVNNSDNVSLIMPKNLLNTPEYENTRKYLENKSIESIIDFGESGFKGVLVETINIIVCTTKKTQSTLIISIPNNERIVQKSNYIFDENLPYWVIYRDSFFDKIFNSMKFDVFNVFRDRQITNSNSSMIKDENSIRVVKSRNITEDGDIVNIKGYDSYISEDNLKSLSVSKYYSNSNVYLTPNMTYKPRLIRKTDEYVVNGSVAILIPKEDFELTNQQMKYISSDEYRKFYKIARNYQTRSLNIDKTSVFWFGIKKDV